MLTQNKTLKTAIMLTNHEKPNIIHWFYLNFSDSMPLDK